MSCTHARAYKPRHWLAVLLLSPLFVVTGCASAPVQQMSNARQAIRAAQDAGAASTAPDALTEAQSLLNRAEDSLRQHMFRAARRDAVAAHAKAVEALRVAQTEKK